MNSRAIIARVSWIEVTRVLAAFLIMYYHLVDYMQPDPNHYGNRSLEFAFDATYGCCVPLFMLISGYFASKITTFSTAFIRAGRLFIPYFILNVIVYIAYETTNTAQPDSQTFIGIGSVWREQLCVSDKRFQLPIISSAWFLRDLILLTLVTPILLRIKPLLLAWLCVMAAYQSLYLRYDPRVTCSYGTCFYYFLGLVLSCFSINKIQVFFSSGKFIVPSVIGLLVSSMVAVKNWALGGESFLRSVWNHSFFGHLFASLAIMQIAYLISQRCPRLAAVIVPIAPATFLLYMLHLPIFRILAPHLPPLLRETYWGCLLPLFVAAAILALFFFMCRWTPAILPYVAYAKIPRSEGSKQSMEK